MSIGLLRALRNTLVVTTVLPPLWFALAALTVTSGVRVAWLEQPWIVSLVYGAFWATPLLFIAGFALGVWLRARQVPLPRLFFVALLVCGVCWLGLLGLLRLFPA